MKDISIVIDSYMAEGKYQELVEILLSALKRNPQDHWLMGNLASVFYELHEYDEAYTVLSSAIIEHENCPFLWWHLAGTLEGLGRVEEAIVVWNEILKYDSIYIDFSDNPCWESLEFKYSLITDTFFRVANALVNMYKYSEAKPYFERFIERNLLNKDLLNNSIYNFNDILVKYNSLYK